MKTIFWFLRDKKKTKQSNFKVIHRSSDVVNVTAKKGILKQNGIVFFEYVISI